MIGLYRDVWIAEIASSRTSLATLMGAMCNTTQCEFRSLCVNSGMLNAIRIVTLDTSKSPGPDGLLLWFKAGAPRTEHYQLVRTLSADAVVTVL